ncbi:PACE efflux transporter [Acetobacter cibinongensis]|nr:PACE efflux transporter [Acetobacter cibinongensis]
MTNSDLTPPPMRSTPDRVRHALLFECLALALVIPTGSHLFGLKTETMGAIGVGSAVTAVVWNYLYNLGFDHLLQYFTGKTVKTFLVRIVHTLLFEAGLQVVLLPAIALYLKISLIESFYMSFSIALFYLVYAFFFNLAYDILFPIHRHHASEPLSSP